VTNHYEPEAGDEAVKNPAAHQNQSGMETVEALTAALGA
jgi:hypothetical protein